MDFNKKPYSNDLIRFDALFGSTAVTSPISERKCFMSEILRHLFRSRHSARARECLGSSTRRFTSQQTTPCSIALFVMIHRLSVQLSRIMPLL